MIRVQILTKFISNGGYSPEVSDFGTFIKSTNWASEATPTLGCSIEISRDIYMSVCLSWSKKRRQKYVGQTRACSKSVLGGKIRPVTPVTPVLLISTIRYCSFSMDGRETFT